MKDAVAGTDAAAARCPGSAGAASDTWVLTWRNLAVWLRVPAYIMFTVVQPTIFTLLFRYVFGGAIPTRGIPGGYVNFLLPGVIGQTAAFATWRPPSRWRWRRRRASSTGCG